MQQRPTNICCSLAFQQSGFPETASNLYLVVWDSAINTKIRFFHFYEAMGLIYHHGAAAMLICLFVTGVVTPEQYVLDPILILCIQHAMSMLRYYNAVVHGGIMLVLETMFQWTTVSNMELYIENHWTCAVCALTMMYAHLIIFGVAGAKIITCIMISPSVAPLRVSEQQQGSPLKASELKKGSKTFANSERPVEKRKLQQTLENTDSDSDAVKAYPFTSGDRRGSVHF